MSDQQNVALVQKVLEAFGRGDVQTILDSLTEDCEFYNPGPANIPYTGTHKGHAEIRQRYFEPLLGTQNSADLKIDQFVAQDNTVVAIGRYKAKVNATGKPIDTSVAIIFQIQGGKIQKNMVLGDTDSLAESYRGAAAARV